MRLRSERFLAAAMALAALACGVREERRPQAEAPAVARLLEHLRPAQIRGPEVVELEWPAPARSTRLVRPADRRYVARVALEENPGVVSDRRSLFGPAGTSYRFRLAVAEGSHLRFGIGAPDLVPGEGSVRFVVRAESGRRRVELFARELADPGWVDVVVPLEGVSGAPTTLRLLTSASGSARWAAWSAPEIVRSTPPADTPEGLDVLLISLDTLRADRLGCYGYERPTSPFLDRLAADSFRFQTAVSAAPWTLPSHRALFTGLYPTARGGRSTLPLAEVLWRSGYRTEGWAGGGVMDFRMGFGRGFDNYRAHDWINDLDRLAERLGESADRQRFVFLHTYEPHDPYIHAEFAAGLPSGRLDGYFDHETWIRFGKIVTPEERRYVQALYDGDIAYTDRQLEELFARLEAAGALERAIVVVTSDHGEQFWEHGTWRHGQTLFDHQLLVPLILHLPPSLRGSLGIDGVGVIEAQVRLIDIYPTLLELLGIEIDKKPQGRSLVPLLLGRELPAVEALAEALNVKHVEAKAVRTDGLKLIRTRSRRPEEAATEADQLFDLEVDPGEQRNLVVTRPREAAELAELLEERTAGAWNEKEHQLDAEALDPQLQKQLEALGYLGN